MLHTREEILFSPRRQLLATGPADPQDRVQGRNYTSLTQRRACDRTHGPGLSLVSWFHSWEGADLRMAHAVALDTKVGWSFASAVWTP